MLHFNSLKVCVEVVCSLFQCLCLFTDDGVSQLDTNRVVIFSSCVRSISMIKCSISTTGSYIGQPHTRQHSIQLRGLSFNQSVFAENAKVVICDSSSPLVCPQNAVQVFPANNVAFNATVNFIITLQ
jgi:hypothetical protein